MVETQQHNDSSRQRSMAIVFGVSLFALIVVGRSLPHMWNFAPVAAAGLFAGYLFASRIWGSVIILSAMFISDLIIGMDSLGMRLIVYTAFVIPVFLGSVLKRPSFQGKPGLFAGAVCGLGLGSSLIFFLVSNLGVWLEGSLYPRDLSGLALCFVNAIPFYRATLIGDGIYLMVFFGLYQLALSRIGQPMTVAAPARRT